MHETTYLQPKMQSVYIAIQEAFASTVGTVSVKILIESFFSKILQGSFLPPSIDNGFILGQFYFTLFSWPDTELHKGKQLHLFYSLIRVKCLEQCLAQSRYSIMPTMECIFFALFYLIREKIQNVVFTHSIFSFIQVIWSFSVSMVCSHIYEDLIR